VYYASSETRINAATKTVKNLSDNVIDYCPECTQFCALQRDEINEKKLRIMAEKYSCIRI